MRFPSACTGSFASLLTAIHSVFVAIILMTNSQISITQLGLVWVPQEAELTAGLCQGTHSRGAEVKNKGSESGTEGNQCQMVLLSGLPSHVKHCWVYRAVPQECVQMHPQLLFPIDQ